ncbi:MAG TPA: sigma-70 family RNA polymerase sigma factor [Myxococcaceae bacterium]|nr:sigma-70 family RNA polymerase sigma factor [Myxococcaceae bacterium]
MSPRVQRPSTTAQEVQLLQRLRAGDQAARTELVRRYQGRLLRQALEILHDRALAEDAVQDTWLVAFTRLNQFEGRSSLLTWLTGIAINRARDCRRKESRVLPLSSFPQHQNPSDPPTAPPASQPFPEPVTEATAERLVFAREKRCALDAEVQALPATQRSVVLLELSGYSPAETRDTLKITDLARRVRLSRARARLRTKLVRFAA